MQLMLDRFYAFLDQPIRGIARIVLVVLAIPLLLHYGEPLWNIHMKAPQYPKGLDLDVYSYKLEGGNEGKDIPEINGLNHYIGMREISEEEFPDLDWLPFAFGLLVVLTLRVAAIGNIRMLIDLLVVALYLSAFAFARFYYTLYQFGHDLDPKAPFEVEPFMPVLWGTKQIANFTTESYPRLGSYYVGAFVIGVTALVVWHLVAGRRAAVRKSRADAPDNSAEEEAG